MFPRTHLENIAPDFDSIMNIRESYNPCHRQLSECLFS